MFTLAILLCIGLTYITAEDVVPPDPAHTTTNHACKPEEELCWKEGKLLFTDGECYTPLEQGPCPSGEWFRYNSSLPHLSHGGCYKRECDVGSVKVDTEDCVKLEDAAKEKCSPGNQAHQDVEGKFQCGAQRAWKIIFEEKGICTTAAKTPDAAEPRRDLPDTPPNPPPATNKFDRPCTSQEALCWKEGKLLFTDGNCYTPLEQGPCPSGEWFRYNSSLPHLSHGGCYKRECDVGSVKVDTEDCVKLEDAAKEKCSPGNQAHQDVEGKFQCGAQRAWKIIFEEKGICTTAAKTPDAAEPRRDLPDTPPNPPPATNKFDRPCTSQEALCWKEGKLLFTDGNCYTPLEQGPCPSGEWFRYNSSLPHLSHGGCYKRECDVGSVKVDTEDCVKLEDAAKEKCSPGNQAHQDVEGKFQCGAQRAWKIIFEEKGNCTINETKEHELKSSDPPKKTVNDYPNRHEEKPVPVTPAPTDPHKSDPKSTPGTSNKKAEGRNANEAVRFTLVSEIVVASITLLFVIAL